MRVIRATMPGQVENLRCTRACSPGSSPLCSRPIDESRRGVIVAPFGTRTSCYTIARLHLSGLEARVPGHRSGCRKPPRWSRSQECPARLADIHEFGMEPDVIAAHVLEGDARRSLPHIHAPGIQEELWELFDEISPWTSATIRRHPGFDQRTVFEKTRREKLSASAVGPEGTLSHASERTRPRQHHYGRPAGTTRFYVELFDLESRNRRLR